MLFGGHRVTLVCLPDEVDLINVSGVLVRMPIKGRKEDVEIDSTTLPGSLSAAAPTEVTVAQYELVALAMQEPQYRAPEVRQLLAEIAHPRGAVSVDHEHAAIALPCTDTRRGSGTCRDCYTDASVWDAFDPALVTLCSPDPQAFRPPGEPLNLLQVRLPTNFKAAAFSDQSHTALLKELLRI
ncbi:MAG: hypothetical protein CM1200mP41_38100 [Gammaproteobacteria bacterium]|nr:MAG: hypothetical protein CM1200mP41_38100 [Gammaproteobacteria bacterium]